MTLCNFFGFPLLGLAMNLLNQVAISGAKTTQSLKPGSFPSRSLVTDRLPSRFPQVNNSQGVLSPVTGAVQRGGWRPARYTPAHFQQQLACPQ